MIAKELDKTAEGEAERLRDEMEEWERFYVRFKPRLDELLSYEERIRELEAELAERDKVVKLNLAKNKYQFAVLTVSFIIVSALFLRVIIRFGNPWVFFWAGVLIGVGFAYLTRFWINIV